MSKLKTSLLSRSLSLARMALSVQVSELKEKVLSLEGANLIKEKILLATVITEKMGELKGAALKIGQLLSLDAGDFLPPEAIEVLQKLQKDVSPLNFEIIENQIKLQLKEKFNELQINRKELAVASIGQVHRAIYKNQEIVLKVQYPGIKETIPKDLKMLRFIINQWALIFKKSFEFDSLLQELEQTLLNETNYLQEAQNLIKARELFQKDSLFLVPKIYPELCTDKILAMEKMYGLSLTDWIQTKPSISDKEEVGKKLLELFMLEFFTYGFVQTDPNPGNFLISPDKKIVLLDFGATKEYDEKFRKQYLSVLKAAYDNDQEKMLSYSYEFNLVSSKESSATLNLYCQMISDTVAPFRIDQLFSFSDEEYVKKSKQNVIQFMKESKYSPPPKNIIFLHRKLGGIFQIIRKMDVSINLHKYWIKHLK